MNRRLDENLGGVSYDNLITDMCPPADVFSVRLAVGQGVLERGSLLALENDGTMELIDTTTTGKANAVLAELADTGVPVEKNQEEDEETATQAEPETVHGIAYRTGHFNTNRLITAEGYTITAEDREALRVAGILLSDAVEI